MISSVFKFAALASTVAAQSFSNSSVTSAVDAASATSSADPSGATTLYTTVVDTLTTYCASPTTLVTNGHTYVVTEATTLTITDCPCTAVRTSVGSAVTQPAPVETAAHGNGTAETFTTVVMSYTTVCPEDTTIVHGSKTIVGTKGQTLTVTDCPCTLTTTHATGAYVAPSVTGGKIVSIFTTYCSEPTTFVQNSKTYAVTAPTTLTITDCPYTAVETATTHPVVEASSSGVIVSANAASIVTPAFAILFSLVHLM